MKRLYSLIGGPGGIVLTVYLWIVLGISTFLTLCDAKDNQITIGCLLTLIPAAVIAAVLMNVLKRLEIKPAGRIEQRVYRAAWFFGFALLGFAVLLIYYRAYYPGGFTEDSINQYREALTGQYNNWHPVLQTLFAFTLPLAVSGGWIGSVALFQMLCFSFAAAYMCSTVLEYGHRPYAIASFVFIYANPVTGVLAVTPWKDTSFAIAAMMCLTFTVRTYYTDGKWISRPQNTAAAVICFAACSIFRHNGFFFTLPLFMAIVIMAEKRFKIAFAAGTLALCVIILGPLYAVIGVESPGSRASESVGLPMTVIGEVAAREPEAMDEELSEFVYAVASPSMWENYYKTGSYNSIKFSPDVHNEVIEEYGVFRVVGLMFKAFRLAPKSAFRGLFTLTSMVHTVTDDGPWEIFPYVASNDLGIVYEGDYQMYCDMLDYSALTRHTIFKGFFWLVGVLDLAVIAGMCAKLRRDRNMWKKLLIAGSMLVYNFGTMLLLSGDDFRFFYYSYTVIPMIMLVLMRRETVSEKNIPAHSA